MERSDWIPLLHLGGERQCGAKKEITCKDQAKSKSDTHPLIKIQLCFFFLSRQGTWRPESKEVNLLQRLICQLLYR